MGVSPRSVPEAEDLLRRLGAPPRLLTHLRLVGQAAEAIVGHSFDVRLVQFGVVVHDAGKILHPGELDGAGAQHEPDGERLLVEHGVDPRVARCCLSHARWAEIDASFEELLVALADKLRKGARHAELERRVAPREARTGSNGAGCRRRFADAQRRSGPRGASSGHPRGIHHRPKASARHGGWC